MDHQLWWLMVVTGVAAALVSVGDSYLGRSGLLAMTSRQRFVLQLISYVLLSVSIAAFIGRGLMSAS